MNRRRLSKEDYEAAQKYAAEHRSDPFAFQRACHRLSNEHATANDVREGLLD